MTRTPTFLGHQPANGRRPWSTESRQRFAAQRIGIAYEEYRDQVAAGNKWCSRCKRWQPRSEFGPHKRLGLDTCCRESSRAAARQWQRDHRGVGRGA